MTVLVYSPPVLEIHGCVTFSTFLQMGGFPINGCLGTKAALVQNATLKEIQEAAAVATAAAFKGENAEFFATFC